MQNKKNRKIDWLLILPAGLLLIEGISVVVLLATGYEITQPMMFFLLLLAAFLAFQVWQHLSVRIRVQKAVAKIDEGKVFIDSGQPFEAIGLWKELLLSLPRDKYLDVLNMLEDVYGEQNMNEAVQQVKAIRSESLNFFEMTRDPQKATAKDRKDWQARALELRKMIKALPTEAGQDLSESLED
jgi:tetratricopeptide (TPR) repeat protein